MKRPHSLTKGNPPVDCRPPDPRPKDGFRICYGLRGVAMTASANPPGLLALDTGVRETGWAVFQDGQVVESGVAGLKSRRKVEPKVRISHLIASLSELADRWQPQAVAFSQPSGINWEVPALDLLVSSLAGWSSERGLKQHSYPAQEVRAAIAGHPNASPGTNWGTPSC